MIDCFTSVGVGMETNIVYNQFQFKITKKKEEKKSRLSRF